MVIKRHLKGRAQQLPENCPPTHCPTSATYRKSDCRVLSPDFPEAQQHMFSLTFILRSSGSFMALDWASVQNRSAFESLISKPQIQDFVSLYLWQFTKNLLFTQTFLRCFEERKREYHFSYQW